MQRRAFFQGGIALALSSLAGSAKAQGLTAEQLIELLRNLCAGIPRVRRNIYTLLAAAPNHPVIEAYRQGVCVMKNRPPSDPTSWQYQAAIHGTSLPLSQWPPNAPFATCEHRPSIFFLSWHRMYLYFFERIVREASGYPDFALPYWDYSNPGQRALPPPFQGATGSTNCLYDGTRKRTLNDGSEVLRPSAVDDSIALSRLDYLGAGNFQSSLESTPHDTVHTSISGNMGAFETAGLDPIFWVHHCNIDRLWEKWLSQPGRANPTGDLTWMNQTFNFVDENKNHLTLSGAQVLFIATQLNYQYEDPQSCVVAVLAQVRPGPHIVRAHHTLITQFLLARDVKIPPEEMRIDLHVERPEVRERLAGTLSPDRLATLVENGTRFLLSFEGVRTQEPVDAFFEVYLGLPSDVEPNFRSPYYAGNLTLFGADEQSRHSMMSEHAGVDAGMTIELDVTDTLIQVTGREEIARDGLTITLVPVGVPDEPGARFTFNPEAEPHIDAIVLSVVHE
jgi:Common central domain of tyrosinase/Polyphenol oxidase middle domain